MKAITQDRYGGPEVLTFTDVDDPRFGPDDVLVRVRAASVNARDWHVMRGDPRIARLMDRGTFGARSPRQPIRGTDFAGVVEAVGRRVTRLAPGDEVFGEAEGAFAELVRAPEDVVGHKPANLTFEQAAALPLAATTAFMAISEVVGVGSGQRVLINGASGGVGTYAVQLAVAAGAAVTAVCSTRNVELARSLGAHHVVDHTREDFTTNGRQYDVVLDLVGNRSLRDLGRSLVPSGTLILSGGGVSTGGSWVGPVALLVRGMLVKALLPYRLLVLTAEPSPERLEAIRRLAETGVIRPVVDRTYALPDVAEAIRYVEDVHASGKVVVTV